ncbi:uncharacterized protein [Physcomitrium patens]|uniref:uncharacterized protein isoform X2 n=1 Tax=Physcomitrium patens TaxID=3218 RepID=UPI000D155107|nr:transcription factor BIM1-like isoform X3 [Physcomitrium patens]|eukprot:XP_024396708.1 transcription factor BIM1-like isoform X3 [Physcomitrella patens]
MAFIAAVGHKQLGPDWAIGSPSSLGHNRYGEVVPEESAAQQQREFYVVQKRHAMTQQQAERSQPHHFARREDTKPSTHDFLSLYDKGAHQLEIGSSSGLPSSLTTHDFLQPLERSGTRSTYRDAPASREKQARVDTVQSRNSTPASAERNLPTVAPTYSNNQVPYAVNPNSMNRMVNEADALRQGRGYSMVTLSSPDDHNGGPESSRGVEVAMDPEVANARDNLAHWPGVSFKFDMPADLTFPTGSQAVKGAVDNGHQSIPAIAKQWTYGIVDVPKRSIRPPSEDYEDEDEDSSERPKGNRKESISCKGDTAQRMDVKNGDMRGSTPRSKHSATEQRRRSKINDRFQMLRDLVPHSDQKRDKASFLLEVIEYIQVLQEKVRKYETTEQGRHQERLKSMVWDICKVKKQRGAAGSADEASQLNALIFAKDFNSGVGPVDVKPVTEANGDVRALRASEQAALTSEVHSTAGINGQQRSSRPACSIHSCVSSLDGEKEHATAPTAQPLAVGVPLQQAIPLPYALSIVPSRLQSDQDGGRGTPGSNSPAKEKLCDPDPVSSRENGSARANSPDQLFELRPRISPARQAEQISGQQSKAELQTPAATAVDRIDGAQTGQPSNGSASRQSYGATYYQENVSKPSRHSPARQNGQIAPGDGSAASPCPTQPPPRIQGGVINVSSVYSQSLLDTLTRALQSSGVDLSRANISVQIDLGTNVATAAADTSAKVATTPESSAQSHQSQGRTRPAPVAAEPAPALKRPKLENHE